MGGRGLELGKQGGGNSTLQGSPGAGWLGEGARGLGLCACVCCCLYIWCCFVRLSSQNVGKCVKVDLRTAERLGGSIERVGVYHFSGPRILINSPRIYTTSSFPPLLHLFLLLLLPKQQTLPQCVPGGLSPQSRQPSWSLPRALRSCRLSLVSLCRPRVLPACSLIRE